MYQSKGELHANVKLHFLVLTMIGRSDSGELTQAQGYQK